MPRKITQKQIDEKRKEFNRLTKQFKEACDNWSNRGGPWVETERLYKECMQCKNELDNLFKEREAQRQ